MILRIKYILKKIKIKFYLIVKNDFKDGMNRRERLFFYFKKIISHPKRFLDSLTGKEFNIDYLEIVLTTVCTLNCRGCSALMNYYKKPSHTDKEMNIKSLKRILSLCDSIDHLRLLGGEPLCYPYLFDILNFLNGEDKIKKITIVTNGTLLIRDDEIINILKNKKFNIFISNYGDISNKKDKLINDLAKNNINYILGDKDFLWRDYGNFECRNRSKNQLKKQFLNCQVVCRSLYNGKIHQCPRSTHGANLKLIPLRKEDYIDLFDTNISDRQLRRKLYKFFYSYVPYVEACNYCNNATKELKNIPAGQQLKK